MLPTLSHFIRHPGLVPGSAVQQIMASVVERQTPAQGRGDDGDWG